MGTSTLRPKPWTALGLEGCNVSNWGVLGSDEQIWQSSTIAFDSRICSNHIIVYCGMLSYSYRYCGEDEEEEERDDDAGMLP